MWAFKKCAVIVAHPDDETLWAGGTILIHPESDWTIITLCRKNDPDRAPKFFRVIEHFNASGAMGDLDDSPDKELLNQLDFKNAILSELDSYSFDLILTHSPDGEYTRNIRHEETAKAVMSLWEKQKLSAQEMWLFAYEDGGGKYLPRPIENADLYIKLPEQIWRRKYEIITKIYGFDSTSFEAKTTPKHEAFWCFKSAQDIRSRQFKEG